MMDPSQSVKRFMKREENVDEYNVKVQTKAALKGWSALTGDKTGSTPQSAGPKKVNFILSWKYTQDFLKRNFKFFLTLDAGVN